MPKPKAVPLDRLASRKKGNSQLVWIPLDPEQADELNALKAELDQSRQLMRVRRDEERASAQLELDELEERHRQLVLEVRENSIPFLCESIGHKRYDELLSKHQPTNEERREADQNGVRVVPYSPNTFPPALILESVKYVTEFDDKDRPIATEPLTPEFVERIWNGDEATGELPWNTAELMTLFKTAAQANTQRRVVDLGNGSRRTRSS